MSSRHMPADDFDNDFAAPPPHGAAIVEAVRHSLAGQTPVTDAMSRPPAVHAGASLEELACLLEEKRAGELMGMVTTLDLARWLGMDSRRR